MTRRIRTIATAKLFVWAAAALLLCSVPDAVAQQDVTATQSEIAALDREAAQLRDLAAQASRRADGWDQLAKAASDSAAKATDPMVKKSWEDGATEHAKRAKEERNQAEGLSAQANEKAAQARAMEASLKPAPSPGPPPPPASTAAEPKQPSLRVEDVLGLWQTRDGPPLAIALLSQAGAGKPATSQLIAHTKKRAWTGTFAAAELGPVVKLAYTPKAAEMNPEIPDWARRAAEGRLVWRIELTPKGESYDLSFSGKWFAGEVTWNPDSEDPKSVGVADEKTPYEFELELNYGVAVAALEKPTISIQLKTATEYDPDIYPIDALTQGQLFSPRLTFPAEMAKTLGQKLTVNIKATKSGDTEPVELKMRGRVGTGPVTYLPDEPVLISDNCAAGGIERRNPRTLSTKWIRRKIAGDDADGGGWFWTWVAGEDPGPCLQLDVKSGDPIEVRYNEIYVEVPTYPSWVQRALARHHVLLARLRVAFQATASGNYDAASVTAAKKGLRMLANYERLLASDKLTDVHRFNLGQLYLGDGQNSTAIVLMDDLAFTNYADDLIRRSQQEPPDPSLMNPLMKAFLEGLSGKDLSPRSGNAANNVDWTSPYEENLVRRVLAETSEKITSTAIMNAAEDLAFGGYNGLVMSMGGAQLWLAVTGTDHHGVRQTGWDRFFAAVGFASNVVLTLAGGEAEQAFSSPSKAAALGKGLETDSTLLAEVGRSLDEAGKGAMFAGVPETVTAAEREQLVVKAVTDLGQAETPVSCAFRTEKAPAISTLMEELRATPGASGEAAAASAAERSRIMAYMREHWGANASIVGGWTDKPILPLQEGPTCNGMAANYLAYKLKGVVRLESEMRRAVIKIMREQIEEFDMQPGGVSFGRRARQGVRTADDFKAAPGFIEGFDNLAVRDYLRSLGAKVTEILPAENPKVKLRHIWAALQKDYGVKVVVDFAKRIAATEVDLHAVIVDEVIGTVSNGRTNITAVRVYDSNIGRIMEIPARDFNHLLARDWTGGGVMTLVRFRPTP